MSDVIKLKSAIDFTPKDKKIYQEQEINNDLSFEEALDKGFLVSGLEVMVGATMSDSCYFEPWNKEIGNIKDNDVLYANAQMAIEHPELSKYVTNTVGLFAGRKDEIIDISNCDFSNVWNTDSMFKDCHNVGFINLGNNTFPKNVDAAHMFENCYVVRKIDGIKKMDVSKVLSLNSCFKNCENLSRLDLKDWCTPFLEDMSYCFNGCKTLSYLRVDNFDTSICKGLKDITGGGTLPHLVEIKRELMRMPTVGKNTSRDDDYEEGLDDRRKSAENLKMKKYEESPMLLALSLKVAKNIKGMDFNDQEKILNALHLSKEDFDFLNKKFLTNEYENIDVENNSLIDVSKIIENMRDDFEDDYALYY